MLNRTSLIGALTCATACVLAGAFVAGLAFLAEVVVGAGAADVVFGIEVGVPFSR